MGDCEPLDLIVEEPLSNGYNISSSLGADAGYPFRAHGILVSGLGSTTSVYLFIFLPLVFGYLFQNIKMKNEPPILFILVTLVPNFFLSQFLVLKLLILSNIYLVN